MKKSKFVLCRMQAGNVEIGIEIKDLVDEVCRFIKPDEKFFFQDIEEQYNCIITFKHLENNDIIFNIADLNTSLYHRVLFSVKQKLSTKFEIARFYFRIIQ